MLIFAIITLGLSILVIVIELLYCFGVNNDILYNLVVQPNLDAASNYFVDNVIYSSRPNNLLDHMPHSLNIYDSDYKLWVVPFENVEDICTPPESPHRPRLSLVLLLVHNAVVSAYSLQLLTFDSSP